MKCFILIFTSHFPQLFANAMVGAGLADDPRTLLTTMNALLTKALEKH